jgi:hypothetical protein
LLQQGTDTIDGVGMSSVTSAPFDSITNYVFRKVALTHDVLKNEGTLRNVPQTTDGGKAGGTNGREVKPLIEPRFQQVLRDIILNVG